MIKVVYWSFLEPSRQCGFGPGSFNGNFVLQFVFYYIRYNIGEYIENRKQKEPMKM